MSAQNMQDCNPVAIARYALMELVRTSVPPTPENYSREYRRAAGLSASTHANSPAQAAASEGAGVLLNLAETIGQTAAGLTVGIERFGGDLKAMFGEVDQLGPDGVRGLIEGLTASGLAMQKTIETSRNELESTRTRLEQVTTELEKTRAQVRTDPLTGSTNRRGMVEILGREIARARRTKSTLCVAILDIDHFKRINDEHGHDVVDQALVHFSKIIKLAVRETDVLCRFGGEEFVAALPDTATQLAFYVVDRLRLKLDTERLSIASGELQIRFSAGIAEMYGEDDQAALLKRADEAMYAAKRARRNRVLVARRPASAASAEVANA